MDPLSHETTEKTVNIKTLIRNALIFPSMRKIKKYEVLYRNH